MQEKEMNRNKCQETETCITNLEEQIVRNEPVLVRISF